MENPKPTTPPQTTSTSSAKPTASIRESYLRLSEETRAHLLVRAAKTNPGFLRAAIIRAHIAGHRLETAAQWLKGTMLKRVEQCLLGKEEGMTVEDAVYFFFKEGKHPLFVEFFKKTAQACSDGNKPNTNDRTTALNHVRTTHPEDPHLDLFESWVMQECHFEAPPTIPEAVSADLTSLDTELRIARKTIAELRDIGSSTPEEMSACVAALDRANTTATGLATRIHQLSADAGEPEPDWSTREEFLASWQKLAGLAETGQHRQLADTTAAICRLLSTMTVQHRLPRKQAQLTALAKEAAAELASQATAFAPLLAATSQAAKQSPPVAAPSSASPDQASAAKPAQRDTARDWLEWACTRHGSAAEELQQQLTPICPKLADLLASADWHDLQWPATETPPQASPQPGPAEQPTPAVPSPQPAPPQPAPAPATPPAAAQVPQPTPVAPAQPAAHPTPQPTPPATQPPPATAKPKEASHGTPHTAPAAPDKAPPPEPARKELQPSTIVARTPEKPQPAKATAAAAPPAIQQKPASPPSSQPPKPEPPKVAPPSTPQATKPPTISDVVWDLARQGRWGLASHLARLDDTHSLPPSWAFEAAALGPRVNYEISPLSERLTGLFLLSGNFQLDALPSSTQPAARLLLAGAALRPALLAPLTNAASVLTLTELHSSLRLNALGLLVNAAAEFALHRQPLQPQMLQSSHDRADWEQQLALVRAEIRAWLEKAPKSSFTFAPALRIWLSWTGTNGALVTLLERTASSGPTDVADLNKAWARWANAPAEQVQGAMKSLGQWKAMDGIHRDKLIARVREAVSLANRLLALLSQPPQHKTDFREEKLQRQLDVIRHNLEPAGKELQELASPSSPADLRAAAALCMTVIQGLTSLLSNTLPLPGAEEPNPRWLVDAELLHLTSCTLSPDGLTLPPAAADREVLLNIARKSSDWRAAWDAQITAENHAATAALLDSLRWQQPAGIKLSDLETERQRQLEACRQRVDKAADDTRRLLDEFVALGLCRQEDYDDWGSEVEKAKRDAASAVCFAPIHDRLAKISRTLQTERQNEINKVRQRLDATQSIPKDSHARILSLLNDGDTHTATDYLDLVSQGRPLPQATPSTSIFKLFFDERGWLPRFEKAIADAPLNECWQAVRDGGAWHGLDFQFLSPEQRKTVADQLVLWDTLQRQRSANQAELLRLAAALGLQPIRATSGLKLGGAHIVQPFDLKAEPLADRATAVIPAFGSDAAGRYTLHLVWGEPDMEELLTLAHRDTGDTSAHIIVTFRKLSARERRELAEEARKPERLFKGLVVDTALFAFACTQTAPRLATLLRCGLPFSCSEPYTIAAGDVPPEMFFGRGRELDSLAAPRGSCFVYGGRQLGKTALLRALERRFHHPENGRAAVYLDLKHELFTRGRPIDDLWNILVARLKEAGVLADAKVGASAGQEALFHHLKTWLGDNPNRRLLLLLDEADSFLEQDGKQTHNHDPFPRCQRLKGLMEATDRRFKVVFAGLHNVQRTTRVSNHPLAHFGEPICIGPMLEEAESREARALVEQPLQAAGFYFDLPETVSLLLAYTNYYPSLIQLFCHHLLIDLRTHYAARFPVRSATPPCVITSQHVKAAYANRVRKPIQEKVQLTLDLDKRYELIAYLVAFYHTVQVGADGVDLRDIRQDAAAFWPVGFAELRTDDEFRSLMEEMIGLGILRQVPNTNLFTLRNQNVAGLLGTQDHIAQHLESAKTWEPALKYEAETFRRVLSYKPKLLFSPLTAQQENELKVSENRVSILYGHKVSGLDAVRPAMESDGLFGKPRTVVVRACVDASDLSDQISRLERPARSQTMLLVPPEIPWDEAWVAAASQRTAQFTSKDAFLTVLFLADPSRAACVLDGLDGSLDAGVRELSLRPWHDAAVRQWLADHTLGDDRAPRERILQITGNWPALLARLDTSSRDGLTRSCEELQRALEQPAELAAIRADFGLADQSGESPLRVAAQLERFTPDDVCEYLGATEPPARERITSQIRWADRLGLLTLSGNGLKFDPIASKALLAASA